MLTGRYTHYYITAYYSHTPEACFRWHEQEKRCQYIGPMRKGGWTCSLTPTCLLHVRRDGQVNISCLQETYSPILIEEGRVLQQFHPLPPLSTRFCPSQSTNHVPERVQISSLSQGHWLPSVNRTVRDGGMYPSILNILLHALNHCIIIVNVDRFQYCYY